MQSLPEKQSNKTQSVHDGMKQSNTLEDWIAIEAFFSRDIVSIEVEFQSYSLIWRVLIALQS